MTLHGKELFHPKKMPKPESWTVYNYLRNAFDSKKETEIQYAALHDQSPSFLKCLFNKSMLKTNLVER